MKRLEGKIVAITRPLERSEEAASIIKEEGGIPFIAPTLELHLSKTESLMKLCNNASLLDWLIFTSPASLDSLYRFCPSFNDNLNPDCLVGVIGPRTARALEEYKLTPHILPDDYTAEGLLKVIKNYEIEGKVVGIPRTFSARDVLPEGLRKMGAQVLLAEAYESTLPTNQKPAKDLINCLFQGKIDAIIFTSPLTVHNLMEIAGKDKKGLIEVLKKGKVIVVSIGPITGKALQEYDINYLCPAKFTVRDMLNKLMDEI
jgi:uroporphyrinogen-III synthase